MKSQHRSRTFFLALISSHLLLTSLFLDRWITPNPTSRALPVAALVERGTLSIDGWESLTHDKSLIRGHYYSDKAPLSSLVVVPVYAFLRAAGILPKPEGGYVGHYPLLLGDILCGSLPFCLLILLITMKLRREHLPYSVLWATMACYGGYLFLYAGTFFGHLLAMLFLVMAYKALAEDTRPFQAGLWLGAAFLTEYTLLLALPIWGVQSWIKNRRFRDSLFLTLGAIPAVLSALLYNWLLSGNPLAMPYGYVSDPGFAAMKKAYGFAIPQMTALYGLTVGPSRGLFIFAPNLAAFIWLGIMACRKRPLQLRPLVTDYVAGFSVGFMLLISSYYMWDGGWAYGPRHLIPMTGLWLYRGLPALARHISKAVFFGLSLVGLTGALLAKITVQYMIPPNYRFPPLDLIIPSLAEDKLNHDGLLERWLDIDPIRSLAAWVALFVAVIIGLTILERRMTTVNGERRSVPPIAA
jgi:hypothetical protein